MELQQIFEYLRDNLRLSVDLEEHGAYYEERASTEVRVKLSLKNPETGEYEVIAEERDSI